MIKNKLKYTSFYLLFFFGIVSSYSQSTLKELPQLKVWLRSDTLVTLNPDSSVSLWKDIIKGISFAPPSALYSPLLKKNHPEMNNKPYVKFDGVVKGNGLLSQGNISLKNNFTTVLIVGQLDKPTNSGFWICYGLNGVGSWNLFEVESSGRLSFFNAYDNRGAGMDSLTYKPAGNTTVLDKHPAMVMCNVNPANAKWSISENFVNKHTAYSSTFNQATSNSMTIGYRTGGSQFGDFKMAELMIFDSTLTPAQLDKIKYYLQDRYSERVDLGADITVPYGFCNKVLSVTNPKFTSYLWSTGATTNSISINKGGNYWVDVTDIYGLHSIDTVKVVYPQVNKISASVICSGSSLVWDTKLSKKGYTFKWQDNSTDSLYTITQGGKYVVKVTDSVGCSYVSDTVTILVDGISISLGSDTTLCSGSLIGLKQGSSQVSSYLWSTGSTSSTIAVTTSGNYWVSVKSKNNCSAVDTIRVTISGTAPSSNFSFSGSCLKSITSFTDLSTPPVGESIASWSWNFGDGQSSTLQNTTHMYSDTGSYVVQLSVTTAAGCTGVFFKTIHIYPLPTVDFLFSDAYEKKIVQFTNKVVTHGYAIGQWSWNFGDASSSSNTSSLPDPQHTFLTAGSYSVTLEVENVNGCKSSLTKEIMIRQSPVHPKTLSQLKVWLRSDTLVTLNPDSSVSLWKDIIKGISFAPPSALYSPLLKKNHPEMNNKPYVKFDGVVKGNGLLSQGNISLKNNFTTVLIVGQLDKPTPSGFWVCYGLNGMGSWNLFEAQSSGRLAFFNGYDNLGAGIDAGGNPAGNTTVLDKHPAMIVCTVDPANDQWNILENFTNKHTNFSGVFDQAASNAMTLGYRTGGSQFGDFKMAELMIFDSTLNPTQLDNIKHYLQDRYSEKVNLGSDITVPYGFCNKVLSVTNPKFTSYLWSTGATTNSISINKTGTYWVDVTDIYGFHSIDTVKITYPVFNSLPNSTICSGNSIAWDTKLSKKGYDFKWQDNSSDSLFNINLAGKYYVTITDTVGCSIVSDTVTIRVDNIANIISLGADTALCAGNSISLKSGVNQVSSYLWSTGSTNATLPISISGNYWLTVKSLNNCPATDTIHVTVNGVAPTSNFSLVNTCLKNTTVFTDLSLPPPGETIASWKWDFGDSTSSLIPNPTHVYADTGKYTVQLLVTTAAGCSELHTQTIAIYPRPKLNFTVSNLCEDVNTLFTSQVILYGYAVAKWSWNFADPASGANNSSILQNPVHKFTNGGIYPVTVIAENNKGCSDTLSKNVVINAAPITDFSYSIACKDDAVLFKDLTVLPAGTTNTANYWSFGNGTSTQLNPSHVFPASVKYTVIHIVTASNGCKDTMVKSIDVHASPTARFASSNSCESSPTIFTDQSFIPSGTVTAWQWNFENIAYSTLKNPEYSFIKAGNVIVKQVVISDFGCKDSTTKTIVVYPKPNADFTATPEYGNPGQSIKFTNNSTGATSYLWNFDDGETSTLVNPTHIYTSIGLYKPMLVAANTTGCTDTAWNNISILKRLIDVAITGTTTQVQNGGGVLLNDYLSVHVNLLNKSTTDIFALDLYMETNDGTAIKESWTGKFLKGGTMGYDFKATPNVKAGEHFVCVYALNPNGLKDEVPTDNKVCNALDETSFEVLAPYPNPTEDVITIPIIIPKAGELTMTIIDSKGVEIDKFVSGSLAKGLQQLTVDTRVFFSGLYICRIQLDDQTIFTKFIKK